MEGEGHQKELFEFKKPKKSLPKLGAILKRGDFGIVLTSEKIIFISIGFILLLVVFYAIGVERGRAQVRTSQIKAAAPLRNQVSEARPQPLPPTAVAKQSRIPYAPVAATPATAPAAQGKPAALQIKGQVQTPASSTAAKPVVSSMIKPYTIVAVTFSRKETAFDEVGRLKKIGFDAFVLESEPYFLACVGTYETKDGAQKALPKVRQRYKDAYIKSR